MAISLILVLSSCKHDPVVFPESVPENGTVNGNGNYNTGPCSPDTVYFQNQVLPLIISNCTQSGCHDAVSHQGGIILDNYANIMNFGDVHPGDPGQSAISTLISTTDPDLIMPPANQNPLTETQIQTINTWIQQGALKNGCQEIPCDTSMVTFSGRIMPLLSTWCTGCHTGNSAGGNLELDTYQNIRIAALDGSLLGSIEWKPGFTGMPGGGDRLSDCAVSQIKSWINQGAPEN